MSHIKGAIEHVRKYRKLPAKIGMMVTYAGHPYRLASTDGSNLVLRSELCVHPNDEYMNYAPPLSTMESSNLREIMRLKALLYEMTSPGDWLKAGYSTEQYEATLKEFIQAEKDGEI